MEMKLKLKLIDNVRLRKNNNLIKKAMSAKKINQRIGMMLNMFRTVRQVLFSNNAIWGGSAPMQAAYDELEIGVANLEGTVAAQTAPTEAFTATKKEKKAAMAKLADCMRRKVQAFASATGNTTLYVEMNVSESKIKFGSDLMAKTLADRIYGTANGMAATDKTEYSITAGDLSVLILAINDFNALLNVPRIKISTRKGFTKSLTTQVKDLNNLLKKRTDNLMAIYKESAFEFWENYTNARTEMNPAFKIAHIAGLAVDAVTKQPLYGVKVIAVSKPNPLNNKKKVVTFEEMTNTEGQYMIKEISPEVYDVTYEVPGYSPVTKTNVKIAGGEHESLSVELNPIN